jgi:DNA polymerase I-like protein with 3'-5' exonuclease and polymerase domains
MDNTFSLPKIPGYEMEITDDQTKLTGDTLAIDFETFYEGDYSMTCMDARSYCTHEKFDAYIMSAYDGNYCWVGHPKYFNWAETTKGKTLVSFNASFDYAVYLFGLKAPVSTGAPGTPGFRTPFSSWVCSRAAANYLSIYGALSKIVAKLWGIEISKEVRAKAEGVDFRALDAIPDDMKEYVAGDSYYCLALWDKFERFWPEHERVCWLNTCLMGWRGVPTNREAIEAGLEILNEAREQYKEAIPLEKKLSIPQLRKACADLNIPPPETTSKNSEKFTDWLEQYGKLVPWVSLIGKYRSVNRLISLTERMLSRVYTDHEGIDRIPYTLTYCGASTGRWTAGGDKLNLQQLNRDSVMGFNQRELIQTPENYKLVVCDWAGIEARLTAWLCGQEKILETLRAGEKDIYAANAKGWGLIPESVTDFKAYCKETPGQENLRQHVKAGVLACGFSAGWSAIQRANPGMDRDQCQAIVDMYRSRSPEVVAWWRELDALAARGYRTPSHSFALTLPSGRKLYYRNCYKKLIQPKDGRRPYFATCVDFGYKSSIVNTNLLSNNNIQSIARDLMVRAFNRLCKELPGAAPCLLVHDEAVVMVPADKAEEYAQRVKDIMEDTPEWANTLPLLAEPEIMDRYRK